jgi:predicted amidohydrolase YtcJ
MQPAFFWEFGDGHIANYGQERADTMFPIRSLTALGVRVAGSSDAGDAPRAALRHPAGADAGDDGRPGLRA